jgi:hypothetical protein
MPYRSFDNLENHHQRAVCCDGSVVEPLCMRFSFIATKAPSRLTQRNETLRAPQIDQLVHFDKEHSKLKRLR